MKRILSVALTVVLLCLLSGCSSRNCDICGKSGADNPFRLTETWYLCDSCYRLLTTDSASDLSHIGAADADSRCLDCGQSVPPDRYYCDSCLGYGTCQDCGQSIASDRFYCDSCLYD